MKITCVLIVIFIFIAAEATATARWWWRRHSSIYFFFYFIRLFPWVCVFFRARFRFDTFYLDCCLGYHTIFLRIVADDAFANHKSKWWRLELFHTFYFYFWSFSSLFADIQVPSISSLFFFVAFKFCLPIYCSRSYVRANALDDRRVIRGERWVCVLLLIVLVSRFSFSSLFAKIVVVVANFHIVHKHLCVLFDIESIRLMPLCHVYFAHSHCLRPNRRVHGNQSILLLHCFPNVRFNVKSNHRHHLQQ